MRKLSSCRLCLNTWNRQKPAGLIRNFGQDICILLVTIFTPTLDTPVPVIYEDAPKKKHSARRATWDGSRASSAVDQLLSSSKGFHGYGSSGG